MSRSAGLTNRDLSGRLKHTASHPSKGVGLPPLPLCIPYPRTGFFGSDGLTHFVCRMAFPTATEDIPSICDTHGTMCCVAYTCTEHKYLWRNDGSKMERCSLALMPTRSAGRCFGLCTLLSSPPRLGLLDTLLATASAASRLVVRCNLPLLLPRVPTRGMRRARRPPADEYTDPQHAYNKADKEMDKRSGGKQQNKAATSPAFPVG